VDVNNHNNHGIDNSHDDNNKKKKDDNKGCNGNIHGSKLSPTCFLRCDLAPRRTSCGCKRS
jgi:hypothetical protein